MWLIFAIIASVINNIAHVTVPQLHIDYYHIGYEEVVYPLLNLIFQYPEPYLLFFFSFLIYFALGTVAIYYAAKGICGVHHILFQKNGRNAADES